jgi:serine/threonine-protein kinase
MGSVWLARDLNLQVDVAVKLIDPSVAESTEAIGRFQLEARAAATIRSTHVVQILDHGVDHDKPFIAMELLKGENLGQRLERLGRLSPRQTATILAQVGRALSIAHAWGIVHRDLKPDNVFLVEEGEDEIAKVLDFGIARRLGGLCDPSQSKTRTGAMLGTPYYMSPEQATGQPVDPLTDIWSFGVIAFECLTGQRAFEGESIGALFHGICMQPMPVPSRFAEVPAGFDEWFARAVARDKTQRFLTIKEAAEKLRLVCGCASLFTPTSASSNANSTLMSSESSLSTTARAAVSAETGRNFRLATTIGRVRRRPFLSSGIALSAIALLGLTVTLVRFSATPSAAEPRRVSVLAASPNASVVQPIKTVTSAEPQGKAVASNPAAAAAVSSTATEALPPKAKPSRPTSVNGTTNATTNATKGKPTVVSRQSKSSVINQDDNAAGI